jgi:hypothetical protein
VVPDPAAIAADAVALAELPGGTGHEQVRIGWLQRRLERAPRARSADKVGNLVWTFGLAPYRLAVRPGHRGQRDRGGRRRADLRRSGTAAGGLIA